MKAVKLMVLCFTLAAISIFDIEISYADYQVVINNTTSLAASVKLTMTDSTYQSYFAKPFDHYTFAITNDKCLSYLSGTMYGHGGTLSQISCTGQENAQGECCGPLNLSFKVESCGTNRFCLRKQ